MKYNGINYDQVNDKNQLELNIYDLFDMDDYKFKQYSQAVNRLVKSQMIRENDTIKMDYKLMMVKFSAECYINNKD